MDSNTGACYNRDGTLNTDIAYQPCSNSTTHSYCCGTNHQGAGRSNVANDVCEPNGLCQNYEAYDGTNEGVKLWWRQSCTDPTWQSPYCLSNVCNTAEWQDENAPVNSCGDNRWCCGPKSCCSTSSSIFALAATIGPTGTPTPSPSTSTPTPGESQVPVTSSTEAPATTTSTSEASPSNFAVATGMPSGLPTAESGPGGVELSTAAKAGIGAGVSVGVILVLVIVVLALQLRKKTKAAEKDHTDTAQFFDGQEKNQTVTYAHAMAPVELSADSWRAELGNRDTTELPEHRGQSELPASHNQPVEMDTHDKK